ncbi:unnamed protein product, partial [Didymodactylos carnosus]
MQSRHLAVRFAVIFVNPTFSNSFLYSLSLRSNPWVSTSMTRS